MKLKTQTKCSHVLNTLQGNKELKEVNTAYWGNTKKGHPGDNEEEADFFNFMCIKLTGLTDLFDED